MRLLLQLAGRQAVKTAESLGKAFRRFVSIFVGEIDHFIIPCQYIQGGQVQTSVPKIRSDGHTCNDFEALLEIKGGNTYMPGDILRRDSFRQMRLHIPDGFLHCFQPFHASFSLPVFLLRLFFRY